MIPGRSSKTTTQRKLRVLTPATHSTPKPGTGRRRRVQPANMVPSLHFGKVDATPARLSICAFLHGQAALTQPWTSQEMLSSDSSFTLAIRSHPWAVQSWPLHTSKGPSSSPAPVLSTALCSTPLVVTGFLLLLTPLCCLELGGSLPMSRQCLPRFSEGSLGLPCDLVSRRPLWSQACSLKDRLRVRGECWPRCESDLGTARISHSALGEIVLATRWTHLANTLGMLTRCKVLPNHSFPVSI